MDSELDHKVPPHSVEAEMAVLGAILRENDRLPQVAEVLVHPKMFYRKPHQIIWQAMTELYRKAEPIDLLTLQEGLQKEGQLEAIGGMVAISKLMDATPTAQNALYHSKIVMEKALFRGMRNISDKLARQASEAKGNPEDLLDEGLKGLVEMRQQADPGGLEGVDRILVDVFRDMDSGRRGHSTGFMDLDKVVAGLEEGNFAVVAARPSIGKTAFTLSLARHLALRQREPVGVAYFYLEANRRDIGYRLLAAEANLSLSRIKKGDLEDGQYDNLTDVAKRISERPIHVDGTPGLKANQIRGRTWQLKSRLPNLGLVVVDHIGRMGIEDRRLSRERQVAETSAFLADMAKQLGVVVIAISQLNRECENRAEKKPQLSDLRDSGALEQDADLVLLLHRPGHYVDLREEYSQTDATVIVAKQRDGPTDEVKLRFNPVSCRFENAQ
jgi:replicative DNA helicase